MMRTAYTAIRHPREGGDPVCGKDSRPRSGALRGQALRESDEVSWGSSKPSELQITAGNHITPQQGDPPGNRQIRAEGNRRAGITATHAQQNHT